MCIIIHVQLMFYCGKTARKKWRSSDREVEKESLVSWSTGVKNFLQNRLPPSRKLGKKLSLRSRICQSPPTSAEVGARKKLGYRPSRKLGKNSHSGTPGKERQSPLLLPEQGPTGAPFPRSRGDWRSFPSNNKSTGVVVAYFTC